MSHPQFSVRMAGRGQGIAGGMGKWGALTGSSLAYHLLVCFSA